MSIDLVNMKPLYEELPYFHLNFNMIDRSESTIELLLETY